MCWAPQPESRPNIVTVLECLEQLAFHADGKRSFLSGSCPDSLLILSRIDSVTPSTTFTENGGTFEDFEVRKGPAGVFHHFCRIVIPHRNYP